MKQQDTTSAEFFDAKYRASHDPWNFAADRYEQTRYDMLMRALGDCRYVHAWEPGCSIGVLTEKLAQRCDRVDAWDLSQTAVNAARQRCGAWPGVQVRCASLTDLLNAEKYDLIVLSEIGYYYSHENWRNFVYRTVCSMQTGSVLVLCHWIGTSQDHTLSGDEVHDSVDALKCLRLRSRQRHVDAEHAGFRLDVWQRMGGPCA